MSGYKIGMAEEAVIADLTTKLTECQAREAKLREALSATLSFAGDVAGGASWWEDVWEACGYEGIQYALQDGTALKEYRKKVLLEAANAFEDGAFETPWGLRRMAEE